MNSQPSALTAMPLQARDQPASFRLRQPDIWQLYQRERQGVYDEALLRRVGWGLFARCEEILAVYRAVHLGEMTCPRCGGPAQRIRRLRHRAGEEGIRQGNATCPGCGQRATWQQVKEHLRQRPRCLRCGRELAWRYSDLMLGCPLCQLEMGYRDYRVTIPRRQRLPCPCCGAIVRRPRPDAHVGHQRRLEEATCSACGGRVLWRDCREALRHQLRCRCGSPLARVDKQFLCAVCGRRYRPAAISRRLRERSTAICPKCGAAVRRGPDEVRCGRCRVRFPWSSLRRHYAASRLLCGAGPCEEFAAAFPRAKTDQGQMLLIDRLLHAVHARGPLASYFIEDWPQPVTSFLDRLAESRV